MLPAKGRAMTDTGRGVLERTICTLAVKTGGAPETPETGLAFAASLRAIRARATVVAVSVLLVRGKVGQPGRRGCKLIVLMPVPGTAVRIGSVGAPSAETTRAVAAWKDTQVKRNHHGVRRALTLSVPWQPVSNPAHGSTGSQRRYGGRATTPALARRHCIRATQGRDALQ
jgi:hypothetical protein